MADKTSTLSNEKSLLERRLRREKVARSAAEALLESKSTELYLALEKSKRAKKQLELALWASQESLWDWQAQSDILKISTFSMNSDDVTVWSGTPIEIMSKVHEDDLDNLQFHWSQAVFGGKERVEFSFRLKLSSDFQWVRLRGRVLRRGNAGEALHIVGTTKDITTEREAEQSFQLMASAFSSSREPMVVLSSELTITECNNAFVHLVQATDPCQCLGLPFNTLLQGQKVRHDQLNYDKNQRFETSIRTQQEQIIPVDVSIALFESHLQTSSHLIATLRDISERKSNEDRLRQMALNDDLTGLGNRNALSEALTKFQHHHTPFVLLFIDLDGFKAINDTAGHERGDAELRSVGSVLSQQFSRIEGVVVRWGGDEFIVALPLASMEMAVTQANQFIEALEKMNIIINGIHLSLSASIGVAAYPEHSTTIEGVLQHADAAMYQAKNSGKGQVYIYREGLHESIKQQVSMLNELKRAVEHELLDFYIQGKYDTRGKLRGGEVLCRWISGLHGAVSPTVFIPIAEQHQLDKAIGLQALEAACEYLIMMETQSGYAVPLSINISVNQMLDPEFPFQAVSVCDSHQIHPSMIELELTESIFIRDKAAAIVALNALREAGFRLSLDDFGSGFSSLSYLRSFEFEVVKVDKSLIKDINANSKGLALFKGVVAMLTGLQIEIVVEGVENESYLPFMQEADVNLMQGFYFDKPMPCEQFLARNF